MATIRRRVATTLSLALLFLSSSLFAQNPPKRTIVITVDDLPAASAKFMSGQDIVAMNTKLVTTLHSESIPAVGFVNEHGLYKTGEVDDRIKALSLWVENGLELGNHTFAHTSLNNVTLQAWEEDVIRGETVTRLLLAQHKMHLRYLRHPFLDTGRDLQTRREAEAFLASRGYQIAPVTMDAWDWMFAGVYDDARKRGDTAMQQKLLASYLDYTAKIFDFNEKLSRDLFGYEPSQILLLHGNWLEADHIADLLDLLRQRGYRFVSLEEALGDPVYSSPDEYVGEGTGWLDHWAITRGRPPQNHPVFPQWVLDAGNAVRKQMGLPTTAAPN
jgi:peptidoglycan/xylan/chitin deacetylase (PgdA/CDA1 family)